jgi:CRP-like cAMP-binding protein
MFAEAFENSLLCILPRKNFLKLLLDEPAIALTIINNIGKRLSQTAYFIENLSTYDLTLRLGKLLLLLAGEYGSNADASKIKIRLTHQDIANMIATSRQTVTTLINQFKELGLIRYEGREIIVSRHLLSGFIDKNQQPKS